jgi:hypothetical protein
LGIPHHEEISRNSGLEDRRGVNTADSARTDLQVSTNGVLNSQGIFEESENGRTQSVLHVVLERTSGQKTVVTVGSEA